MKTLQSCKVLALALVLGLAALTPCTWAQNSASPAPFSAKVVAQQRQLDYTRAQNELLRSVCSTNPQPWHVEAEPLIELRTMEYQLQWFYQNGLLAEAPALVLVGVPLRHKHELPGRILEVRLQVAKLDHWQQQLAGRVFPFAQPAGQEVSTFTGPVSSSTYYPVEGDFVGANAYAGYLVQHREFADAAKQFEVAAKVPFGGTPTREWEYQNLVSSAWAYLMAGNFEKSYSRLATAQALPLQAEVPARARFLLHLYHVPDAPALPGDWDTALPR